MENLFSNHEYTFALYVIPIVEPMKEIQSELKHFDYIVGCLTRIADIRKCWNSSQSEGKKNWLKHFDMMKIFHNKAC